MRNNFPKRSSGAPLNTLSKFYGVPIDFVRQPLSFEAVFYCRSLKGGCCSISGWFVLLSYIHILAFIVLLYTLLSISLLYYWSKISKLSLYFYCMMWLMCYKPLPRFRDIEAHNTMYEVKIHFWSYIHCTAPKSILICWGVTKDPKKQFYFVHKTCFYRTTVSIGYLLSSLNIRYRQVLV